MCISIEFYWIPLPIYVWDMTYLTSNTLPSGIHLYLPWPLLVLTSLKGSSGLKEELFYLGNAFKNNKWEDTGWICLLVRFAWERSVSDHSKKGSEGGRAVGYWIREEEIAICLNWESGRDELTLPGAPICHSHLYINLLTPLIRNQMDSHPSEVKYAYYYLYLYTVARGCSSYCITRWKIQVKKPL